MAVQQQQILPAPFIEAAGKTFLDDLQKAVGQFKTADLSKSFGPQFVADQDIRQKQAEALALTGIGGYQPFLTSAAASAGPQAYQQFMSPYQQDVIDTTLAQQNLANQLRLGGAQQAFLGQDVGALSTLGGLNQAQEQAKLQASQQLAQQQLNQPLTAAQAYGSGVTGLIAGYPGQTRQVESPSPSALQTGLSAGSTLAGIYRLLQGPTGGLF
jgi:hypothetical protein